MHPHKTIAQLDGTTQSQYTHTRPTNPGANRIMPASDGASTSVSIYKTSGVLVGVRTLSSHALTTNFQAVNYHRSDVCVLLDPYRDEPPCLFGNSTLQIWGAIVEFPYEICLRSRNMCTLELGFIHQCNLHTIVGYWKFKICSITLVCADFVVRDLIADFMVVWPTESKNHTHFVPSRHVF